MWPLPSVVLSFSCKDLVVDDGEVKEVYVTVMTNWLNQ